MNFFKKYLYCGRFKAPVTAKGLNIIQFSQSKNEVNPKLLVYLVIYGCYGVFPAIIELKKIKR